MATTPHPVPVSACIPLLSAHGEEEEGESTEGESDEEAEGGEGGLVEEVGSHPFSSMAPDQDQHRREQMGRSKPPTEEEIQQKK